VLALRQDIYDKRDELFDVALKLGRLDDPAYRRTRDVLNVMAMSAKHISPYFMMSVARSSRRFSSGRPVSADPRMDREIEIALRWLSERILRYLLKECVSGWLIGELVGAGSVQEEGMPAVTRACSALWPVDRLPSDPRDPERDLLCAA
jgi:hypothetical protein